MSLQRILRAVLLTSMRKEIECRGCHIPGSLTRIACLTFQLDYSAGANVGRDISTTSVQKYNCFHLFLAKTSKHLRTNPLKQEKHNCEALE